MGFFRRLIGRWFGAGEQPAPEPATPALPSGPATPRREAPGPRHQPLPWAKPMGPRLPLPREDLPTRAARLLAELDTAIEGLTTAILQDPRRLRLEASWRGLHALAGVTAAPVVLCLLPASQDELAHAAVRSHDPATHPLFALQQAEWEAPQGAPIGLLLADSEWSPGFKDTHTLRALAAIAAAMQVPLLTGAAPSLFGLDAWSDAPAAEDCLEALPERWREFRRDAAGAFALPVMPRLQARPAEGAAPACWTNGAYLLAAQAASALRRHGLGAATLEPLALPGLGTPECPIEATEVPDVVRHGILPVVVQEDGALSAAPAAGAANLPVLLVQCRMAQCLAMMARERLRRRDAWDCDSLTVAIGEWLGRYLKPDAQFMRPLYQARVAVRPDGANPDCWTITLGFRLWPPGDALSVPMRATATVPAPV